MLVKTVSALAAIAFAATVSADLKPYKPQLMKMSAHQMFGLGRRTDTTVYQPTQAVCGAGATCEEACGKGFTPCASGDDEVHCFNPSAAEICCPNLTGASCDKGYYCTSDKKDETYCCPDNLDLAACAKEYSVDGGLAKQTPKAASTSSASSSTISVSASTNGTSTRAGPATTAGPSATFAGSSNSTASLTLSGTSKPTQSNVKEGAANLVAPASALALLAAGLAALL